MRHLLGFSLAIALVVGIAAAATTPDPAAATTADPAAMPGADANSGAKHAADRHAAAAPRRAAHRTAGQPMTSSPVDPKAGISEQGTPNATVTNGGQLAH